MTEVIDMILGVGQSGQLATGKYRNGMIKAVFGMFSDETLH